jgi:hypothetical protein
MAAKILAVSPLYAPATSASAAPNAVSMVGVLVRLDLDNNGRRVVDRPLLETVYAGLVAEFNTGSATTVLDASIATDLATIANTDTISSTQRAYIGGTKAWP